MGTEFHGLDDNDDEDHRIDCCPFQDTNIVHKQIHNIHSTHRSRIITLLSQPIPNPHERLPHLIRTIPIIAITPPRIRIFMKDQLCMTRIEEKPPHRLMLFHFRIQHLFHLPITPIVSIQNTQRNTTTLTAGKNTPGSLLHSSIPLPSSLALDVTLNTPVKSV